MKKPAIFILIFFALIVLSSFFFYIYSHTIQAPSPAVNNELQYPISSKDNNLSIIIDDLLQAGYVGVTQQQPQNGKYVAPTFYFWVHEDYVDNSNNLLMISQYHKDTPYNEPLFNYGSNIHSVPIVGGRGQEAQLNNDGRIALNFAKGNYYIVIIGPNAKKVEHLAEIIAAKIQ